MQQYTRRIQSICGASATRRGTAARSVDEIDSGIGEEARPATFARCSGTHAHWRGRLMTNIYIQTKSALSLLVRARCARPNKACDFSSVSQEVDAIETT